jgi:hypothetical protein
MPGPFFVAIQPVLGARLMGQEQYEPNQGAACASAEKI